MALADQIHALRTALDRLDLPSMQKRMDAAVTHCVDALAAGKPVLVCGNGGSASDAQHIAGELVGRFLKERRALNVRALAGDAAVLTAWGNDYSFDTVFSRQVEAYAAPGGVLIAISTSGNSKNVLLAAEAARAAGMRVIGLTGEAGGKLAPLADVLLDVPSNKTPRIQEMHIVLYHYLCEAIEARF
jgi:D-sedoheptulose 7-phosphate isomerase